MVAIFSSNLVHPRNLFKNIKIFSFYPFVTIKPTSFQNWSASKSEFSEPPPKPNFSSGCEMRNFPLT
jgi:hypothetical protein